MPRCGHDGAGSLWDVGLLEVVLRHGPAGEAPELLAEHHLQLRTPHERDPGHERDRLAREIVLRRAQTAGHEHDVGARGRERQGLRDAVDVVPHRLVMQDVDPDGGQLLGHPPGVRVRDLAEEQLRADRDDLCPHDDPTGPKVRVQGSPCDPGTPKS